MDAIVIVSQLVIALGILNVWLLRRGKASGWRGGSARTLREEFNVYGLPGWFMGVIGALKVLFASLLVVGIWVPSVTTPAAIGLAALMLGAVVMHVKVGDPLRRSLPAFALLALCVVVAVA